MASSASALTSGKLWVRIGPNLPVRCFRSGLVFLRVAGRDPGRRTSVRVVVTEALRRLRGAGAVGHPGLDFARKVENIVGRAARLEDTFHELDRLFRGYAEPRERGRYAQRRGRVVGRMDRAREVAHLRRAETLAERVSGAIDEIGIRVAEARRTQRPGRFVEPRGDGPHPRHHA